MEKLVYGLDLMWLRRSRVGSRNFGLVASARPAIFLITPVSPQALG